MKIHLITLSSEAYGGKTKEHENEEQDTFLGNVISDEMAAAGSWGDNNDEIPTVICIQGKAINPSFVNTLRRQFSHHVHVRAVLTLQYPRLILILTCTILLWLAAYVTLDRISDLLFADSKIMKNKPENTTATTLPHFIFVSALSALIITTLLHIAQNRYHILNMLYDLQSPVMVYGKKNYGEKDLVRGRIERPHHTYESTISFRDQVRENSFKMFIIRYADLPEDAVASEHVFLQFLSSKLYHSNRSDSILGRFPCCKVYIFPDIPSRMKNCVMISMQQSQPSRLFLHNTCKNALVLILLPACVSGNARIHVTETYISENISDAKIHIDIDSIFHHAMNYHEKRYRSIRTTTTI